MLGEFKFSEGELAYMRYWDKFVIIVKQLGISTQGEPYYTAWIQIEEREVNIYESRLEKI